MRLWFYPKRWRNVLQHRNPAPPVRHITAHRSPQAQPTASQTPMMATEDVELGHLMPDSHSHPQLDVPHLLHTLNLQCPHVAAQGVAVNVDWQAMSLLAAYAGRKVLPGFGIHPWWSHLHGSSIGTTWQQLLEAPDDTQLQLALQLLQERHTANHQQHQADCHALAAAGTTLQQQLCSSTSSDPPPPLTAAAAGKEVEESSQRTAAADEGTATADKKAAAEAAGGVRQGEEAPQGAAGPSRWKLSICDPYLPVVPAEQWEATLVQLLQQHPHAFVGEIGIDKAAVIPGSKAKTRLQHQLELMQRQLAIAAQYQRPVSCHCVRGYGHLLQMFAGLDPQDCPPRVMLHSYGGSPDEIPRFCKLRGIGDRFYFSFSTAINSRTPEKLRARIAAVPDDRLLLESDQVTPLEVDAALLAICRVVAEVKGWTLEQAARRCFKNFQEFYQQQLAAVAQLPAVGVPLPH